MAVLEGCLWLYLSQALKTIWNTNVYFSGKDFSCKWSKPSLSLQIPGEMGNEDPLASWKTNLVKDIWFEGSALKTQRSKWWDVSS